MSEDLENIPLEEYPVQEVEGKFRLLGAKTLYRFKNQTNTDGRWLAVCLCESTFMRQGQPATSKSIRIYRWQWRQSTKWDPQQNKRIPTGYYRWFNEQQTTLNRRDFWEKIKEMVDEYIEEL